MYAVAPGNGFTETGNFPGTPTVLAVNMKRDLPNEQAHILIA
jgi:hypothetical protein